MGSEGSLTMSEFKPATKNPDQFSRRYRTNEMHTHVGERKLERLEAKIFGARERQAEAAKRTVPQQLAILDERARAAGIKPSDYAKKERAKLALRASKQPVAKPAKPAKK